MRIQFSLIITFCKTHGYSCSVSAMYLFMAKLNRLMSGTMISTQWFAKVISTTQDLRVDISSLFRIKANIGLGLKNRTTGYYYNTRLRSIKVEDLSADLFISVIIHIYWLWAHSFWTEKIYDFFNYCRFFLMDNMFYQLIIYGKTTQAALKLLTPRPTF